MYIYNIYVCMYIELCIYNYIYIIMHFSHLLFWLLVEIWKFDWLLTFNCYFSAYHITENIEKNKNCFLSI